MSLDLVDRGQACLQFATMFPGKSSGIKTQLKDTNIIPNDSCRICRIDFKTSGRSKINLHGHKNNVF